MNLLFVSFGTLLFSALSTTPDIFWDFFLAGNSVPDLRGSNNTLTRTGRFALIIAGDNSYPRCDGSGCSFDLNAHYQCAFESPLNTTWTIVAIAIFNSQASTILQIKNSTSNLLTLGRQPTLLEAEIEGTSLGIIVSSIWGIEDWEQVYISSNQTGIYLGYALDAEYFIEQQIRSTPLNLTSASQIFFGNSASGSTPIKLLRRVEMFKDNYTFTSTPSVRSLYIGQNCRDVKREPFCDTYATKLPLKASTIDQQTVQAQSAVQAIMGSDNFSTQSDPRITVDGPLFTGNERITATSFSMSGISFSLSLWVLFDQSFLNLNQLIFQSLGPTNLKLEVNPASNNFFVTSLSYSNTNAIINLPGWKFFTFSVLPFSATDKHIVTLVNGVQHTQQVTLGDISILGFLLGESLYGVIRDVVIYFSFMGKGSFADPAKFNKICSYGQFYDDGLNMCQACHQYCSDCFDNLNTQCGWCRSPATLETLEVPGQCYECHDSCASCNGILENNCRSCPTGTIQTFFNGASGKCLSNCAQLTSASQDPYSACTFNSLFVETSIERGSTEFSFVLSFSEPIYVSSLSSSLFVLHIQGTHPSNIQLQFTPIVGAVITNLKLSLSSSVSLTGTESLQVELNNVGSPLSSLNPSFSTASTIRSPVISLPYYEHVDPQTIDALEIVTISADSLATSSIIGIVISQALFHISADLFWALINLNQLIYFAPLMRLKLTKNVFLVFKALSFAVGDVYVLQFAYDYTIGLIMPDTASQPYSQNFAEYGFESVELIKSTSSFLLLLLISFLTLLTFLICKPICKEKPKCAACLNWSIRGCLCNYYVRMYFQGFLEILLFVLLNLQQYSLTSIVSILSLSLSGLFFFILVPFPFAILRILSRPSSELNQSESKTSQRYGQIFRNFRHQKQFFSKHYNLLFLLRRLALVLSLIYVPSGRGQLFIATLLSIFQIYALIKLQPYKRHIDNAMSVVNQFFLLAIYCIFGVLNEADHYSQRTRENLGWGAIGVTAFINLINLLLFIIVYFIDLRRALKQRKEMKRIEQQLASIHPSYESSIQSFQNVAHKSQFFRQKIKEQREAFSNNSTGLMMVGESRDGIYDERNEEKLRDIQIEHF